MPGGGSQGQDFGFQKRRNSWLFEPALVTRTVDHEATSQLPCTSPFEWWWWWWEIWKSDVLTQPENPWMLSSKDTPTAPRGGWG